MIRTGVHQALEELREVISVLRDSEIDELPGGRPQPTFGDLAGLVAESRDAGTEIRYADSVAAPESLPPATGRTAYRVVQEGLTNARKHAAGHPVTVVELFMSVATVKAHISHIRQTRTRQPHPDRPARPRRRPRLTCLA